MIDKIATNVGKGVVELSVKFAKLSVNSACRAGFYEFEQPEGVMELKKKNKSYFIVYKVNGKRLEEIVR